MILLITLLNLFSNSLNIRFKIRESFATIYFLHAYIKIRDRALKKMKNSFIELSDKVWSCYNAETKRSFSQRIRKMKQWAITNLEENIMKDKLLDLCNKKKL